MSGEYSVRLTRRALLGLHGQPKPLRRAVQTILLDLRHEPHPDTARVLPGVSGTRCLRVRDTTVLYQVEQGPDVLVLDIRRNR